MSAAEGHGSAPTGEPRARGLDTSRRSVRPPCRSHLGRVHDALLAGKGRRGKAGALAFVDALQRAVKRGPVQVTGPWRDLYDAVGLAPPHEKTAREALALLGALTPVLARVSGQAWRLDTTVIDSESGHLATAKADSENGHEVSKVDSENGHLATSKADSESGQQPEPERTAAENAKPSKSRRSTATAGILASPRVRVRVDLDRAPPRARWWMDNPLALAFSKRIERCDVLSLGHLLAVTLTVADGVDIDVVARDFADRFEEMHSGAWLVPETSPAGRRHVHGLVVSLDPGAVVPMWQRCGGGIPGSQKIDPIAPDDHAHRHGVIAYALKRRDQEPGEVIVSGLLTMPWALACEGAPENDDTASRLREALDGLPRAIPSRVPPVPELADDAWLAEIELWPPHARKALAEHEENFGRHGEPEGRLRAYWAYRVVRPLAYP